MVVLSTHNHLLNDTDTNKNNAEIMLFRVGFKRWGYTLYFIEAFYFKN